MVKQLLTTILAIFLLSSGCLYIPTPDLQPTIPDEVTKEFIPGKTTRNDILEKLGEPDQRLYNDQYFIYYEETIAGIWILAGGYSGAMGFNSDQNYFCLEFNPDHKLKRYKFFDQNFLGSLGSHPENELMEWMEEEEEE